MTTLDWLLDSDPAIRWQVMRDLTGADPTEVAAERTRVATQGWGARLLALRGPDGQWAGGSFFPDPFEGDRSTPQPWTATFPTLSLLRELGLDPDSPIAQETARLVGENSKWDYDGSPFWEGEVEPCINGRTVGIGAYFKQDVEGIVDRLLDEQLDDGGWNCEVENGATVSSVHTTINVLEGLLEHERSTGSDRTAKARLSGEEYLLERGLLRRKSTGDVIDEDILLFRFPCQWYYDVLRALEHFRSADGDPDPRLAEAVQLVRDKQQTDGTWLLDVVHPGAVHFQLEGPEGTPSRWNTLRALRVLRWAED
jgi:hypothetical protein